MLSRKALVAVLVAGLVVPGTVLAGSAAAAKPKAGEVFLVQGVVGSTWDFSVDGDVVGEGVEAKEIVGGLDLSPGEHQVEATADDGTSVDAMVDVRPGESLDVVLHLPVDARRPAVLTSFANNRSPVPDGNTRLSIAHTAAVGPADIKVDGKVLFSDVASGEQLTVVVPADTYRVAVVPSATDDPPVLGPVDLPVPGGKSMRVYAVGVAERGTMDAIVHTMPVSSQGSATAPGGVPGGTGGQHDTSSATGSSALVRSGLVALAASLALVGVGAVRRAAPVRT
ncbi:DUF4397 domain-containing protein [Nocardioides sp. GXQ0305]|uniref:DUF4397 domain-containing protein n=1 Tax=Nocardioides sp. GXQ0305 TaxID=3423912 RepID=UPI003D7EF17F